MANRFLASLSEFIGNHLDDAGVRAVVVDNFVDFLRYHIKPYNRPDLPVSFVGSVAWHYQDELREAADIVNFRLGLREAADIVNFRLGTVLKTPLAGLVRYHKL